MTLRIAYYLHYTQLSLRSTCQKDRARERDHRCEIKIMCLHATRRARCLSLVTRCSIIVVSRHRPAVHSHNLGKPGKKRIFAVVVDHTPVLPVGSTYYPGCIGGHRSSLLVAGSSCWWYLSSCIVFAPRAASRYHPYLVFIRHRVRTSCGLAPPSESIGSGQIRRNAFSAFLRYRSRDSHAPLIPITFLFSFEPQA
jgi:hypothetical protein